LKINRDRILIKIPYFEGIEQICPAAVPCHYSTKRKKPSTEPKVPVTA
jgi:hypothetical protein